MTLAFRPLCQADRDHFLAYARTHEVENSELTFTNAFLWQRAWQIQVCRTSDILYLHARIPDGPCCYLQPLILHDELIGKAMDALACDAHERKQTFLIKGAIAPFIAQVQQARPGAFSFTRDRDSDEYVYDTQMLATLPGSKYHQKRNHLNRFHAQYQFAYEPLSASHLDACLALYDRWALTHAGTANAVERSAIELALTNFHELGLRGAAVSIDGKLHAFSVGERLTEQLALIHLEKADDALIPELFALINQQTAERAFAGVPELNREEDMGLPGLRQAKLSYRPTRMIEKYDITLAGGHAQ